MDWFQCFGCREFTRLINPPEKQCASCGSNNGKVISREAVESALGASIKDPEQPERLITLASASPSQNQRAGHPLGPNRRSAAR